MAVSLKGAFLPGCLLALAFLAATPPAMGGELDRGAGPALDTTISARAVDTTRFAPVVPPEQEFLRNIWGLDILLSNDGVGLGAFYRRLFSEDVSGFINFSVSESKDDREVEQFDPFTQTSFTPGKLNRFLVLPLLVGVQYRLFREDIVDTFRPYINAGAGPTMIFVSPYVELVDMGGGYYQANEMEFFSSLHKGRPHYTVAGFIGFGANIGSEKSNVFGVNFRYYFTYLYSGGIPSLYSLSTGQVTNTKSDFGGFFITLNFGLAR